MRTFNKQAASLKNNLKQNNLMPLFVVFLVIVFLSLTYKSVSKVSKVSNVGNTMFKEGNRNRRRRVRQGFREGQNDDDEEQLPGLFANEDEDEDEDAVGVTGFRNRRRRVRQGFREGQYDEPEQFANEDAVGVTGVTGLHNRRRRVRQGSREGKVPNKNENPTANTTKKEPVSAMSEGFLSSAKYQGFTSSRARGRK